MLFELDYVTFFRSIRKVLLLCVPQLRVAVVLKFKWGRV